MTVTGNGDSRKEENHTGEADTFLGFRDGFSTGDTQHLQDQMWDVKGTLHFTLHMKWGCDVWKHQLFTASSESKTSRVMENEPHKAKPSPPWFMWATGLSLSWGLTAGPSHALFCMNFITLRNLSDRSQRAGVEAFLKDNSLFYRTIPKFTAHLLNLAVIQLAGRTSQSRGQPKVYPVFLSMS